MAEGGNLKEGERTTMVKRELFLEEGSSVDNKEKELFLLIKITKDNGESLPYGTISKQCWNLTH